jgi:hypothetical protein
VSCFIFWERFSNILLKAIIDQIRAIHVRTATKVLRNPPILCPNVELTRTAEKDAEVHVGAVSDYQAIVDAEWEIIYRKPETIEKTGAKVNFLSEIWRLSGSLIMIFSVAVTLSRATCGGLFRLLVERSNQLVPTFLGSISIHVGHSRRNKLVVKSRVSRGKDVHVTPPLGCRTVHRGSRGVCMMPSWLRNGQLGIVKSLPEEGAIEVKSLIYIRPSLPN